MISIWWLAGGLAGEQWRYCLYLNCLTLCVCMHQLLLLPPLLIFFFELLPPLSSSSRHLWIITFRQRSGARVIFRFQVFVVRLTQKKENFGCVTMANADILFVYFQSFTTLHFAPLLHWNNTIFHHLFNNATNGLLLILEFCIRTMLFVRKSY